MKVTLTTSNLRDVAARLTSLLGGRAFTLRKSGFGGSGTCTGLRLEDVDVGRRGFTIWTNEGGWAVSTDPDRPAYFDFRGDGVVIEHFSDAGMHLCWEIRIAS